MSNDTTSPATSNVAAPSVGSLLKRLATPIVWVEFKNGVSFQLAYVPKARFRELMDSCTEQVYDPALKARKSQINSKKFYSKFIAASVRDWRGVTAQSLSGLANIDISGLTAEQANADIPYSPDQLVDLMDVVYELDNFIQSSAMDLQTFRPDHEVEVKN